jgi:hypothetical protein
MARSGRGAAIHSQIGVLSEGFLARHVSGLPDRKAQACVCFAQRRTMHGATPPPAALKRYRGSLANRRNNFALRRIQIIAILWISKLSHFGAIRIMDLQSQNGSINSFNPCKSVLSAVRFWGFVQFSSAFPPASLKKRFRTPQIAPI